MPHCSQPNHRFPEIQCRLLYVGSDLALLKFLRSTFGKPKYHVVSCPDRDSAERFIKSDIPYQLFVFDLEMRHRAAFDLTQLVRSLNHREGLPSIVVGSEADASLGEFTLASGGNEYVQKQNHFVAIHEAIARLLEPASQHSVKTKLGSGTASRPDKGS